MSSFRLLGVSAACCVALLGPAVAGGQPRVVCAAYATPVPAHASGVATQVADILLECRAPGVSDPGRQPDLVLSLAVTLNVAVTSRTRPLGGAIVSEAVAEVNAICGPAGLPGLESDPCRTPPGSVHEPRFGLRTGVATLEWPNLRVPFPGSLSPGATGLRNPRVSSVLLRGIRARASQVGLLPGGTHPGPPITASLSVVSAPPVVLRNAVLEVARPMPGLVFAFTPTPTPPECRVGGLLGEASVHISEGFSSSFRSGSEADPGAATRVILDFADIPEGVGLSLPPRPACDGEGGADGPTLALVEGHDGQGAGGTPLPADGEPRSVAVDGGRARAVYEVVSDSPDSVQSCRISAMFDAVSADAFQASATVLASLGPRSSGLPPAEDGPIERYAAPMSQVRQALEFSACRSALVFPFVTNQAGFDTGLAISHDPVASYPGTSGPCSLHYYGVGAEGQDELLVQTTTPIAYGEQLVFTLSAGNADRNIAAMDQFQGYVIADCRFPGARGYVFMSDGFGSIADLAMGYVAPSIPIDSAGRRLAGQGLSP